MGQEEQGDKIVILTGFGKKVLINIAICFLFLFAAAMFIFHWPLLTENPFSSVIRFKMPVYATMNNHRDLIVVDCNGTRLILLTPDGRIKKILRPNPLSKRSISYVLDVDADDKYMYILDLQTSPNGAQINGERVLVYDLDGRYADTIYEISHPDTYQREHVFCDVSCYNGKVYVSRREFGKVSVFQIENKKLHEVRSLLFPDKEIFSASFLPDTKSSFVITRDACYSQTYLNNTETVPLATDHRSHWNDLCIAPSGERYYLDSNKHVIYQFRPNVRKKEFLQFSSRDEIKKISDAHTLRISLLDDVLTWCCSGKNEVVFFNITKRDKTIMTQAPYPSAYIFFRWFIWFCSIFLFLVILKNFLQIISGIVRKIKEQHKGSDLTGESLSAWNRYGKNTFALFFAFIAVFYVMSSFYKHKMWNIMESSVKATAAELRNMPGKVFGDYLAEINSPADYNKDSFKILRKVGSSICYSSEGSEFDLGFSVIRRLPDGKMMYVIDAFDRYCIGKIIESGDPNSADLYRDLSKVKDGKLYVRDKDRKTGTPMYFVMTQVFDSKGKDVGIVMISCNREQVIGETKIMISKLSIDLLLLFIIFIFLNGEIKLMLDFRKRRELDPSTGKLLHTVCEGHRSCQFLTVMSLYLDVAFLPTLALELAQHSHIAGSGSMLVALPLTIRNFMLVAALVLGGFLAKYNPGRFMKCSALFSICCYCFQIHAVLSGQYIHFMIGAAALGMMCGMKFACLDAISSCGLQPDPKFRNLVFVNTESLIGAVVGTSIGSLLCAKFGYSAVFILGILLEIILLGVTVSFISSDINFHNCHLQLHNPRKTLLTDWVKMKNNIKHIMRPELLGLLFCVMIPMSILGQFDTFMLPVYNAWSGYSQLLTGFTGSLTKVLALILIPVVFNKLAERGNRLPLFAGMFLLSAGLLFFALDNSLIVVSFLLLLITIFNTVFTTTAERLRLAIAAEDKVKYSDVVGFFHAFQYLGASAAPLIMGFCIKYSFSTFAYIFSGLFFVMLILFIHFSSHFCRSEIGKSL